MRQYASRQNCVDQLALRRSLAVACGLQVFVRHIQIAVTQIGADGELVLSHVREHGSDRMAKRVPAHTANSHLGKSGFDPAVEHGAEVEVEVERFLSLLADRRKPKLKGPSFAVRVRAPNDTCDPIP